MRIFRSLTILGAASALALAPVAVAQARHGADDSASGHHHKHKHAKRHLRQVQGTDAKPLTVVSFAGGVLTLTRDGDTYKGTVDESTEIECHAATTAMAASHDGGDDNRGDDDQGDDRGDDQTTTGPTGATGPTGPSGDDQGDDDQGDDDGHDAMCTSAALKPGVVVDEAKLKLSSTGARFVKIELAAPAA